MPSKVYLVVRTSDTPYFSEISAFSTREAAIWGLSEIVKKADLQTWKYRVKDVAEMVRYVRIQGRRKGLYYSDFDTYEIRELTVEED